MQIFFRWAVLILIFLGRARDRRSVLDGWLTLMLWLMPQLKPARIAKESADSFRLVKLADALMSGGNAARAKVALVKAGSLLGPVTNFSDKISREEIVEKLAQLGSVADAEALAGIDVAPSIKVVLLGKLGTGRARAGDFSAAQNAAKSVTTLVEANVGTNPNVASSAQVSLAGIAMALSASGATDEALRLAEELPDGLRKLQVYAKVAHTLCGSAAKRPSEQRLIQNIADKATQAARQTLTTADKAYERFGVAQTAAEERLRSVSVRRLAKALVSEILPFVRSPGFIPACGSIFKNERHRSRACTRASTRSGECRKSAR